MESQTRTLTSNNRVQLHLKFREDEAGSNTASKENERDENQSKTITKRVTWTKDTIDNEHMGKKKSNICCIYIPRRHTPKYDEQYVPTCSSDDNNELERSNQSKRNHLRVCSKHHKRRHMHDDDHDHGHGHGHGHHGHSHCH